MLVPQLLFGSAPSVSSSVSKLATKLKRGARLEELLADAPAVDLREHPSALVWLDDQWVSRDKTESDFRALLLGRTLFDPRKIPFERSNVIREESVAFLESTAWGAIILNAEGSISPWHTARPLRPWQPSRRGCVAVLRGAARHWGEIQALGQRYYTGASHGHSFEECLPAYGHVAAVLGAEVRASHGTAWRSAVAIARDGDLLGRLERDDDFWRQRMRRAGRDRLAKEVIALARVLDEALAPSIEARIAADDLIGAVRAVQAAADDGRGELHPGLAERLSRLSDEIFAMDAN